MRHTWNYITVPIVHRGCYGNPWFTWYHRLKQGGHSILTPKSQNIFVFFKDISCHVKGTTCNDQRSLLRMARGVGRGGGTVSSAGGPGGQALVSSESGQISYINKFGKSSELVFLTNFEEIE